MKNLTLCVAAIAAFFLLFSINVSAQNVNKFHKGDFALSADFGMGNFHWDYSDGSGRFMGSFTLTGEYGILDNIINERGSISVGGQVGYGWGDDDWNNGLIKGETNYHTLRIATRGTLHYQFIPQLDTYAGLTFGIVDINHVEVEDDGNEESYNDNNATFVMPAIFTGARYMFNRNFGVHSELTWDHFSFWTIGITVKF